MSSVPASHRLTRSVSGLKPCGRHPYQRLTAVSFRAKQRPGRYADGNGLYLVVDPSGAKRWIWRGIIHGKRCDLGLGSVQLVSLADARKEALDCRRTARKGGNPKIERVQAKQIVPTFREIAIDVHAEHRENFRNPKHVAVWLQSLEKHVFPTIGHLPITSITVESGHIVKVLKAIWLRRPETARRVKQRIELVFDWAKAHGHYKGENPTEGITNVLPKHTDRKQHLAALPYQAVPAFVTALRTIPDMQDAVRLGLEFLILTATRTNEVQLATWSEINPDTKTWTIPGERMKSSREHRVPLSDRAVEILQQARGLNQEYLFPGSKPGKPLSNMTFLKAARRLTTATLTTHGFRSSFRDWSAEKTNVPTVVCEAALAHVVKDKTEAAYFRTDLFDKRCDLMNRWAQFVTSTPADVVVLRA